MLQCTHLTTHKLKYDQSTTYRFTFTVSYSIHTSTQKQKDHARLSK